MKLSPEVKKCVGSEKCLIIQELFDILDPGYLEIHWQETMQDRCRECPKYRGLLILEQDWTPSFGFLRGAQ